MKLELITSVDSDSATRGYSRRSQIGDDLPDAVRHGLVAQGKLRRQGNGILIAHASAVPSGRIRPIRVEKRVNPPLRKGGYFLGFPLFCP